MNRTERLPLAAAATAVLAAPALAQVDNLTDAYAPDRWTVTQGSGVVDQDPVLTRALRCDYELTDNNGGFNAPFAYFENLAYSAATITVAFDHRGNHGATGTAGLQLFKDTPGTGGFTVVNLVTPGQNTGGGDFEFSGRGSIDVEVGDTWGIRVVPFNGSGGSTVSGTVVLFNCSEVFEGDNDSANWSTRIVVPTRPEGEVTGPMTISDAPELRYSSDLDQFGQRCGGSGNVHRIEYFNLRNYAAGGASASFNWSYDYDHQTTRDFAQVALQSGVGGALELDSRCRLRETMTGTTQLALTPGTPFGLRVGGQNFDGSITGAVAIWDFQITDPQSCGVADVNTTNTNPGDAGYGLGDGGVDGADLSYYVEQWLLGCP